MAPHAQPPVKGIFTVLAKAMPDVRVEWPPTADYGKQNGSRSTRTRCLASVAFGNAFIQELCICTLAKDLGHDASVFLVDRKR